ncbi:MAG: hypothetical protein [Bacteriophage sp.]|nr:MAG: hypothetical protein [Bacteriophage sp.]
MYKFVGNIRKGFETPDKFFSRYKVVCLIFAGDFFRKLDACITVKHDLIFQHIGERLHTFGNAFQVGTNFGRICSQKLNVFLTLHYKVLH